MPDEPFGEIPLFREIQKILSSSEGPVNLEIARQIAGAIAGKGTPEPAPDAAAAREFAALVHSAEAVVYGYTRMPLAEPARATVLGKSGWITATLSGWRWLFEHLSIRLTQIDEADEGQAAVPAVLRQVAPLLLGMQVGTLVGHLAGEALGRSDVPLPRDDDGRLFAVTPNVTELADGFGVPRAGILAWVAVHEVARDLVLSSVPWTARYFKSLLVELVDSIEIDTGDLERKFMELQSKGLEGLGAEVELDGMMPIVESERHKSALTRVQAFIALMNGYASSAATSVLPQIVDETDRIQEVMTRHAATSGEGRALLKGLIGVDIDRSLDGSGATFCAAVATMEGIGLLNHAWDAPDNLPSLHEVKDPFAWIERVKDGDTPES